MRHGNQDKTLISYRPCPPHEFVGRLNQRERLLKILKAANRREQVVLISGARGSGKSSFLQWAEYEVQNNPKGLNSPAIMKSFLETPGNVFNTYKDLLKELKGHQKLRWFKKILGNDSVNKSITGALDVLEKASSFAGPGKIGVDAGVNLARRLVHDESVDYSQLLSSLITAFRELSKELSKTNRLCVILCDEVQWSSEPDFQLLKDLIRNLPCGIAFVIAFRLEEKSMEMYVSLRQELDRFHHSEIRLSGMSLEEIKELANRRWGFVIDQKTAEFLSINIGDPLCLVTCFNLLVTAHLPPTLSNVQKSLPFAVEAARSIYAGLDDLWKERVDSLAILNPPIPLSLIACLLEIKGRDVARLKDELDQSAVFRQLEKELYDFAHPSLREYRRTELPENAVIEFHSKAAKCIEALKGKLSKIFVDFSLAKHLFFAQKHDAATLCVNNDETPPLC